MGQRAHVDQPVQAAAGDALCLWECVAVVVPAELVVARWSWQISSVAGQGWLPRRAMARVSGTPSISRLVIVAARAPRVPLGRSLSAMANTAP